ncbi:MAG: hypothetical protein RLY16_2324 [Bacteroidota bacterium]
MSISRRLLLKQIGLGVAGIGLSNFSGIAHAQQPTRQISNGPIKLSSNENPYGPPPKAQQEMLKAIATANRYNWQSTGELVDLIAQKNNVKAANILLGPGSTEILDLVARFTATPTGSFVIADPSYDYWTTTAIQLGLQKISIPLDANKKINLAGMLAAIQLNTRLVYICNPNNPTGTTCTREDLVNFVRAASPKAIVVVDEAYLAYTDQESLSSLVVDIPQLIVVKTFSKIFGMAGARVGYAIANEEIITRLSSLQSWPNGSLSVVSVAGAISAIQDDTFVTETRLKNKQVGIYTVRKLQQLKLEVIPTDTNFIYFSLRNFSKDYFELLRQKQISGTRIYEENGSWTRITIGTKQEMEQFIQAIS